MSVSMDLQNQCSYQSPDGWTIAWSQDAIGIHQNETNATASDISSDTNSSDTASTASVQYTGISSDASSSTACANQDEWITPAQFVPSETFPYFNGSASYITNQDMSVQLNHDNKDYSLINLTESLDELVTNTYNNMFVTATPPPPLPEIVQVTTTIQNVKRTKRFRTAYTTDQVNAMEEVFRKQSYLSKPDREKLCKTIGVSDRALKVWFQNRRMKEKKNESTEQISKTQITTNNPNVLQVTIDNSDVQQDFVHTPLSLVDEIGQLMCDYEPNNADQLVHFSNTNGVDFNIERSETTLVNTTEYEPISPPDVQTMEISNWRKNESDEILTLLDFNICS